MIKFDTNLNIKSKIGPTIIAQKKNEKCINNSRKIREIRKIIECKMLRFLLEKNMPSISMFSLPFIVQNGSVRIRFRILSRGRLCLSLATFENSWRAHGRSSVFYGKKLHPRQDSCSREGSCVAVLNG